MELNKIKNDLFILTKNSKWEPISTIYNLKYNEIYKFIKKSLDENQGLGVNAFIRQPEITFNELRINIMKIESHRCCTVLWCLQSDKETNGVRYLVYGTKYNLDSDYGIGIKLEYVDTKNSLEYLEKCIPNCKSTIATFI